MGFGARARARVYRISERVPVAAATSYTPMVPAVPSTRVRLGVATRASPEIGCAGVGATRSWVKT